MKDPFIRIYSCWSIPLMSLSACSEVNITTSACCISEGKGLYPRIEYPLKSITFTANWHSVTCHSVIQGSNNPCLPDHTEPTFIQCNVNYIIVPCYWVYHLAKPQVAFTALSELSKTRETLSVLSNVTSMTSLWDIELNEHMKIHWSHWGQFYNVYSSFIGASKKQFTC